MQKLGLAVGVFIFFILEENKFQSVYQLEDGRNSLILVIVVLNSTAN